MPSNNMENTCDIIITNAKGVVIPGFGIVQTNIIIENGKVKSLKRSIDSIQASRRINAEGKYILPGAIDPHVHYGVYRPIEESARTESTSASIGGVTTMMRMLRLSGSYRDIKKQLVASNGNHRVDYSIHASILYPSQVRDMSYLAKKFGITSFKVYMNLGGELNHIFMDLEPESNAPDEREVNMDDKLFSSILMAASRINSLTMVHAEDPLICAEYMHKAAKSRHETDFGLETWSKCRPALSESRSITKAASLARRFGSNLYFVHIGSGQAAETILHERRKGIGKGKLYIETCPHYLTHSTDFGSILGKVVPPIRSKSDLQRIWSALENGQIDTVGTDHVANQRSMKFGNGDIWSALAGFPGIATMIPVLLNNGVNKHRISLERLVEVTTYNTSRIFGMYPTKGTIQPGSDADIIVIDLALKKKVSPELLRSYSDYTIYDGWELSGWPVLTMVRGIVVMEDGEVERTTLGHGKFIARPTNGYK
ncbi:MAG: amidohydrolase family protein [Nitrososphaeraceae archaeon]